MKKSLLFILFILSCVLTRAQNLNSAYENNSLVSFEKFAYRSDSSFHTSIRPFFVPDLKKAFAYDSLKNSYSIQRIRSKKALNLIFNRNLFLLNKPDYGFTIDPLFDFSLGKDIFNNRQTWVNTRGVLIDGFLGKDFAFSTSFYENQSKAPLWVADYAALRKVMPGQGLAQPFGKDAVDYINASGYISWSPGRFFNFQAGHGRNFWGDGYRSLILSDFSMPHPYFMVTTKFWKIKYVNLYSQFSHPDEVFTRPDGNRIYAKKYSSMQYLSFVPWKRLNISLFESIIWNATDPGGNGGFDFNYLNPVIFLKYLEFDIGTSISNALAGVNLRFNAHDNVILYGQVVLDEKRVKDLIAANGWYGNKAAIQAGVKTFDLFGITNLNFQSEYNYIRPYTYSHIHPVQNYSHAREPLAHPSGANIKEAVARVKYNYKRLYFNLNHVWSETGLDTAALNFGKNIFKSYGSYVSEYGNYTGQGLKTIFNQTEFRVSFLVNPSTNMNLFIGATIRSERNVEFHNRYQQVEFGLRTSLRNIYYDFY